MKILDFSDSDSDFEIPVLTKRQCIDLTKPGCDDGKDISGMMSRLEALENTMKQCVGHLEEQKRIISALESDKAKLPIKRSLEEFKVRL